MVWTLNGNYLSLGCHLWSLGVSLGLLVNMYVFEAFDALG